MLNHRLKVLFRRSVEIDEHTLMFTKKNTVFSATPGRHYVDVFMAMSSSKGIKFWTTNLHKEYL